MKSKALTLAAVSVALAVGTYFGLNTVAPQKHHDEAQAATGPSIDEIFSGSLNIETEDAPPAEVPTEDPATAPGPQPGEETSEEATAEAGSDDVGVDEAIPTDATESAPAAPEAAAEPAPAAEAPAPAPAPAPKAESKPKPEAKPAAPSKPAAKPSKPAAPAANWWGGNDSPDKLSLVYAGSAAYRPAVVLIFNRAFESPDSANAQIKVTDAAGKAVAGQWELNANNRAMLVFPVQKTGRYTVSVGAGLTDLGKSSLGKALKGPVNVK